MANKKKRKENLSEWVGIGLLLLSIATIALAAFLKTEEGKELDEMSIKDLKAEMKKEIAAENYEKAALIRDLLKQKQSA